MRRLITRGASYVYPKPAFDSGVVILDAGQGFQAKLYELYCERRKTMHCAKSTKP